jgi:fructose-specific phosphotransferase system IIA component
LRSTPVENVRQINPFYAKQTQFCAFFTGKRRFHQKTNPIQTQFKANKANNKPNLSQNKANSNPIKANLSKGQKDANFKRNDAYFNRSIVIAPIIRYSNELITNWNEVCWTLTDMILTQILQPDCVKVPVQSNEKEAAITELIDLLHTNGLFSDRDVALEAVLTRERIRSTGTGAGIAIPHCKCNAVKELVMAIGIANEPIEFDSVDGKPVSILFLLVSPEGQTGPHIQALAGISRLMLNKEFRQKLEKAASADEVYGLLNEIED